MHHICAPRRLLAGLLMLVFAFAVIAQSASAALPRGEYRYDDGQWILQQRYHPVASPQAKQYRYHEGRWILVRSISRSKVVARPTAVRPDDRAGLRGIG
jgi:hypothetical protein